MNKKQALFHKKSLKTVESLQKTECSLPHGLHTRRRIAEDSCWSNGHSCFDFWGCMLRKRFLSSLFCRSEGLSNQWQCIKLECQIFGFCTTVVFRSTFKWCKTFSFRWRACCLWSVWFDSVHDTQWYRTLCWCFRLALLSKAKCPSLGTWLGRDVNLERYMFPRIY